jgi:hypothetical protein
VVYGEGSIARLMVLRVRYDVCDLRLRVRIDVEVSGCMRGLLHFFCLTLSSMLYPGVYPLNTNVLSLFTIVS